MDEEIVKGLWRWRNLISGTGGGLLLDPISTVAVSERDGGVAFYFGEIREEANDDVENQLRRSMSTIRLSSRTTFYSCKLIELSDSSGTLLVNRVPFALFFS